MSQFNARRSFREAASGARVSRGVLRWCLSLAAAGGVSVLLAPDLRAQGSLDLDSGTATPPAASRPVSGGADPAPVAAPAASARDRIQDGVRIQPVDLAADPAAPAAPPTPVIAAPALPEPVVLDRPQVIDTARLAAGTKTVSLFGIVGQPGESAQQLQAFLASTDGHLMCPAQTATDSVCLLSDGTDLAAVALVNGAARARDDAPPAYREQEVQAQAARRGIWANLPPPPEMVVHPMVRDTGTLFGNGKPYVLDGLVGMGAPYAAQMQSYIAERGDSLSCQSQALPDHYICVLGDGTDIAKVILVNGAARVADDAPDSYRVQQLDALNNRRGFWLNPPPDLVMATRAYVPASDCCGLPAGDDGADGVVYVGGAPTAVIGGETVFLVLAGLAGWGYYDHYHRWHNAPDRYRTHMERYHPQGQGLRAYRASPAGGGGYGAYGAAGRGAGAGTHGGGATPYASHSGAVPPPSGGAVGASPYGGGRPGGTPPGTSYSGAPYGTTHTGAPPGTVHTGTVPVTGSRPVSSPPATMHAGGGAPVTHTTVPPAGGGFVRPNPTTSTFHPAGAVSTPHVATPAPAVSHAAVPATTTVKHK